MIPHPAPITQRDIDRYHASNPSEPLLVAIYGGPGTGKSTVASGAFHLLKSRNRNVEFVHEVAKDLTWEQRHVALGHQPYIAAKQMFRYDRLRGRVEAIITDTSTLLSLIHMPAKMPAAAEFRAWIIEDWRMRRTLNISLNRDYTRPYNPNGRRQSQESAEAMDLQVSGALRQAGIRAENLWACDGAEAVAKQVADMVEARLD